MATAASAKLAILVLAALALPSALTRRAPRLACLRTFASMYIGAVLRLRASPQFLIVGACDGVKFDEIAPWARRIPNARALFVEPIPYNAQRLRANYLDEDRFKIEVLAIDDAKKFVEMKTFDPDALERGQLPDYVQGMSTTTAKNGLTGHGFWGQMDTMDEAVARHLKTVTVPADTLDAVIRRNKVDRLDVVAIDVEGSDWMVLRQLDLNRFAPRIIKIEIGCLAPEEVGNVIFYLKRAQYDVALSGADVLAFSRAGD